MFGRHAASVNNTHHHLDAARLLPPLSASTLRCSLQGLSMVSTPPTPTTDTAASGSAPATASAPLSQDQFNAYVQSTYGRYPLTIVRGEGCKLFDSNGKVCGHVCVERWVWSL